MPLQSRITGLLMLRVNDCKVVHAGSSMNWLPS